MDSVLWVYGRIFFLVSGMWFAEKYNERFKNIFSATIFGRTWYFDLDPRKEAKMATSSDRDVRFYKGLVILHSEEVEGKHFLNSLKTMISKGKDLSGTPSMPMFVLP